MNIKRMEIVLATRRPFRDTNSFREKHRKIPILEVLKQPPIYVLIFKISYSCLFLGPNVRYVNDKPPNDVENVGIIRHSGPANAKYSTTESRLRSFRDWPPALRQEPKQLAEAGFYYIGLSDQTKCFYCDGGLRNWQPDDDPWTEHARWFSKCGFVRLIKGDEFIARCLIDRPPDPLNKDSQR